MSKRKRSFRVALGTDVTITGGRAKWVEKIKKGGGVGAGTPALSQDPGREFWVKHNIMAVVIKMTTMTISRSSFVNL